MPVQSGRRLRSRCTNPKASGRSSPPSPSPPTKKYPRHRLPHGLFPHRDLRESVNFISTGSTQPPKYPDSTRGSAPASPPPGSLSRLIRATAASAPSKTIFSISCTLMRAALMASRTLASTPGRSRCRTTNSTSGRRRLGQVHHVRHFSRFLETPSRCARSRPRSLPAPDRWMRRYDAFRKPSRPSRSHRRNRPCRRPVPSSNTSKPARIPFSRTARCNAS